MGKNYKIIKAAGNETSKAIEKLEEQVDRLYEEGWVAYDMPVVVKEEKECFGDNYVAYQAMVKKELENTCVICGATRCYFLNYEEKLICAKCAGAIKNMI